MLLTYFWIALAAALGWMVKDLIHQGKDFSFGTSWKKYVGCAVAGLLYGLLSGLPFFRYITLIAVVALVGNSFATVITLLNWVLNKIGVKNKL